MRERVEDLGRICVLADNILESEVFSLYSGRKKDFVDYCHDLSEERLDEVLHTLVYGLDEIQNKLNEISVIAEGMDRLNESP